MPPSNWAATKLGADPGAIHAKVSETMRPTMVAAMAILGELVNGNAAAIKAPTAGADAVTDGDRPAVGGLPGLAPPPACASW